MAADLDHTKSSTWPGPQRSLYDSPLMCRVTARRRELEDTVTITVDGPRDVTFHPGQFDMLYAWGQGEVPISISGDPAAPEPWVHTIRGVGAVSNALTRLRPGDYVGLRGPFGIGWPLGELRADEVIVVAGGLGMAPLRPAMHALIHRGGFRRLVLLYGARSPDQLLYADDLAAWQRAGVEVLLTVDRGQTGWVGNVGVVPALIPHAVRHPMGTRALVCGPEIMMRYAIRALIQAHVHPDHMWVSLERSMHCGVGLCGHCQLGPHLICRDGPVLRGDEVLGLLSVEEL